MRNEWREEEADRQGKRSSRGLMGRSRGKEVLSSLPVWSRRRGLGLYSLEPWLPRLSLGTG